MWRGDRRGVYQDLYPSFPLFMAGEKAPAQKMGCYIRQWHVRGAGGGGGCFPVHPVHRSGLHGPRPGILFQRFFYLHRVDKWSQRITTEPAHIAIEHDNYMGVGLPSFEALLLAPAATIPPMWHKRVFPPLLPLPSFLVPPDQHTHTV